MARERIRFGVDLDRQIDGEFGTIAKTVERRSKKNFHTVLIERVVKKWKSNPEELVGLGLIKPAVQE